MEQFARKVGKPGARILKVNHVSAKPLRTTIDKRYLTPTSTGAYYLTAALEGQRVMGMHDTGSNVTLMNKKLAEQLGLPIQPHSSTYRVASGSRDKFVGRLGPVTLQIHDQLELTVEGIRVMEGGGDRMQLIFGTDIFDIEGHLLREKRSDTRDGMKIIGMEAGQSGVVY